MAVKDRTKPIRAVVTKSPAKYLGPQTLLGLTRHLVQVSCEGVLITAWLTDEEFEKGFENVPEPQDKTYVNPLKAIRLRADAWTDRALERVDQVHCIVRCIRNGETWCDVKIMWKDGRTDIHPIKASDLYDAFENVPEESPVDIECDNGAAPEPKWESAMDDRPFDCQRKTQTLWHVWAHYPDNHNGIKFPFVVYTGISRIAALGVLIAMRDGGAFVPGTRFAIAPCKAPVIPEAAEANA